MLLRDRFTDLAHGGAIGYGVLARAAAPAPRMSVSEWAASHRQLSAKASKNAGPWRNDLAPYLVEPMDRMGVDDPAPLVAVAASAQSGKTEAMLNAIGHMIHLRPRPAIAMMPAGSEVSVWSDQKFGEMVEATEALRLRVLAMATRTGSVSTTTVKRYPGGVLDIVNAGSSKGLQMKSKGALYAEEVAEYPTESGERGDPIRQAEKRLISWGDEAKRVFVSTCGNEGTCRITALVEAGTKRLWHMPAPCCGFWQTLAFERMSLRDGRVGFTCANPACAAHIGQEHKRDLVAAGVWLSCYFEPDPAQAVEEGDEPVENPANPRPPEAIAPADLKRWRARPDHGRHPSYHWWQAISPFVRWEKIWAEAEEADADPTAAVAFAQQTLARPFREKTAAPPYKALAELARTRGHQKGVVPAGYGLLTAAVDVQGDRLEWAVWGWGPFRRGALVDDGIVVGHPADAATWAKLRRTLERSWPLEAGGALSLDGICVDAKFKPEIVYDFARRHPLVWAINGKGDPEAVAVSKPVDAKATLRGRIIHCDLFHIGSYNLKKAVYAGLQAWRDELETGEFQPGALALHREVGPDQARQITAEVLSHRYKDPKGRPKWIKPSARDRNEQLDLAVYAMGRAVAAGWTSRRHDAWAALFAAQAATGADAAPPLLGAMVGAPKPAAATAPATPLLPAPLAAALDEARAADAAPAAPMKRARPKGAGAPAWASRLAELNRRAS